MLEIFPIRQKAAKLWVNQTHRHLSAPRGDLFRTSLLNAGEVCAVGIAGRPCRMLDDGRTVEISRISSVAPPTVNACTRLYSRLVKAGRALGYIRFISYTLPSEPGTSLRAAGFEFAGVSNGGEFDRPSRRRNPVQQSGPKNRWVVPPLKSGLWPSTWSTDPHLFSPTEERQ